MWKNYKCTNSLFYNLHFILGKIIHVFVLGNLKYRKLHSLYHRVCDVPGGKPTVIFSSKKKHMYFYIIINKDILI